MQSMILAPDKDKLKKELEKIEKLLKKAEDRRRVYKKSIGGIGDKNR
jgi:hypothetical protein